MRRRSRGSRTKPKATVTALSGLRLEQRGQDRNPNRDRHDNQQYRAHRHRDAKQDERDQRHQERDARERRGANQPSAPAADDSRLSVPFNDDLCVLPQLRRLGVSRKTATFRASMETVWRQSIKEGRLLVGGRRLEMILLGFLLGGAERDRTADLVNAIHRTGCGGTPFGRLSKRISTLGQIEPPQPNFSLIFQWPRGYVWHPLAPFLAP